MKIDATKQKEMLEYLEVIKSFIECLETGKGCISCAHWHKDACGKSGGQVPPPEVIKAGCKSWEIFDTIPF